MTTETFFVGDLCYVLNNDEWDTVCLFDGFYPNGDPDDFDPEGYLDLDNVNLEDPKAGRPFYILKTNCGDGVYRGSDGKDYSVDSGTIGCIRVSDIVETEKLKETLEKGLGHLHEFDSELFEFGSPVGYDPEDSSLLYFANLDIQT